MAKVNVNKNKSISGGTLYSTDTTHTLATAHDIYDEKRECYVEDYDFGVRTINGSAPDANGNFNLPEPPTPVTDVVKYTSQNLSDAQKKVARQNIGADDFLPLTGGRMKTSGDKTGDIYTMDLTPNVPEGSHIDHSVGSSWHQYQSMYTNQLQGGIANLYGTGFSEGSWPQLTFYTDGGIYRTSESTNEDRTGNIKEYNTKLYDTGHAFNIRNRQCGLYIASPDVHAHSYDKDRVSGSKYYDTIDGKKVYLDDAAYPDKDEVKYYNTVTIDSSKLKYTSSGALDYEATREALNDFLRDYNDINIDIRKGEIKMNKLWSIGNSVTSIGNGAYDSETLRINGPSTIVYTDKLDLKSCSLIMEHSEEAMFSGDKTFSKDSDFQNNSIFRVGGTSTVTLSHNANVSNGLIVTFIAASSNVTIHYEKQGGTFKDMKLPQHTGVTFVHTGYGSYQGWAPLGGTGGVQTVNGTAPDANGNVNTPNTTYSAGTGINISGTQISNSGVRSITQNGSTITVNTGGTTSTITIPESGKIDNISINNKNVTISNKTASLPIVTITAWNESSDSTTTFSFVGQKNS